MSHHDRVNFASKLGAVLAVAGSAVGLGNIWRFPYEAGNHGGAAFILVYLGCVFIFGLPIMMNPLMMIPFVLGYMAVAVVAVILTTLGIIPVPVLSAPWILPAPIKTAMATSGSIPAILFVILTWIILGLVFYPFVKAMERNDLKEEKAALEKKQEA